MILIPKSQNQIQLTGSLSLVLVDTITGKLRQEIYVPNLIVNNGKAFIASRMVGTSAAVMSHMGIGTNETTEVVTQGSLTAELTAAGGYTGYTRVTAPGSASGAVVTYISTFPAQNPSAPAAVAASGSTAASGGALLREAGIFNALTGGTMLCRTTFPIVTKLPADALTITWQITIS